MINKEIRSFRCPEENCNTDGEFNMTWEQFQRHQYYAHGKENYKPSEELTYE